MDFSIFFFFCALTWSSVPEVRSDAGDILSIYSADAIPIRLRGGTASSGRVEVFYNEQWGTICDDGFDLDDAKVICRQLGFTNATNAYTQAHFGEGADPIWLSNLACNGNEELLKDCQHSGWGVANCKHEEDAGVECSGTPSTAELFQMLNEQANALMQHTAILEAQETTLTTIQQELDQLAIDVPTLVQASAFQNTEIGQLQQLMGTLDYKVDELNSMAVSPIRLMGGNTSSHGRVEVWHEGQWGTICDDNWDIDDARVVCRQLGYQDAVAAYGLAEYGEGTGPILMDNVGCTGSEPHLSACAHEGWAVHDCKHEEDAGVACQERAAFSAGWTSGSYRPPSNHYIIPFNSVYTNIGSHYSSSNGRFTAPISGHYFFMCNAYSEYLGSYDVRLALMLNDSVYKSAWIYDPDNHDSVDTSSNSIILHLNKNDYVSIRIYSGRGLTGYERTTFSGFLIHAD